MASTYVDLTEPDGRGNSRSVFDENATRFPRNVSVATSITLAAGNEPQPSHREDSPCEVIDLTTEYSNEDQQPLLKEGELLLVSHLHDSIRISRGHFLAIASQKMGAHRIDFLKVQAVVRLRSGRIVLRGNPFLKNKECKAMLDEDSNEVCELRQIRLTESGQDDFPVLLDISPDSVLGAKQVCFTNQLKETISESTLGDLLFCRWSLTIYFHRSGTRTRVEEESLERTRADACDAPAMVPENILRFNWRGVTRKGGSYRSAPIQDNRRKPGQKYTLFDAFSGGGGVSRGAVTAGFKVMYALDRAPEV